MVITKTVIDDNVMRMKSQPQLATRWLWSFAFFVFKKTSFVLNSFCFLCFQKILLPSFWIHWTSFVLNSFCFICFESSRLITVLHFICSNEIYMLLAFESFFSGKGIWMSGRVRKIITCLFPFYFFRKKKLKSSFDQTRFCYSGWRRLKFVFSRSFFLRVFMSGSYLIGLFSILEICSFLWEICFFLVTRFACSLRFFSLYERTMFSAKRFVCSHFSFWREWDSDTGLVRVLFQVGRFLFVSGAFASPKYDKCYSSWWGRERSLPILASSSWRIL